MTELAEVNEDSSFQSNVDLTDMNETTKWRSNVTSDLEELKKKVEQLERHVVWQTESVKQIISYTETKKRSCFCIRNFVHRVKASHASWLQCILLLISVSIFSFFGIRYFIKARTNELAIWKPRKIDKTIEFGDTSAQYEMPYVYVAFEVTDDTKDFSNSTTIRETLSEIQESQTMRCSIRYFSGSKRSSVDCEWLVLQYTGRPGSTSSFWGYFRFLHENPVPENGSFVYSILLSASDMIFDDHIEVDGFYVSITRDQVPADFANFIYLSADGPIADSTSLAYTVDYSESVVDGTHYFTNSIAWITELDTEGRLRISARPNLRVDYWTEYVAFGYVDWIFGMGGLYNFYALSFFWLSYYVATYFNDDYSMGILPRFSFIFNNLEMILWIKHNILNVSDAESKGSGEKVSSA